MNRWLHRWWTLGLLAWLAAVPAWAQVDEAAAERFMRTVGLWEQLLGVGPQVKVSLQQIEREQAEPGSPQAELLQRLSRAAEEAFNPVAVRVMARRDLAARLQAADLPLMDAWFGTARGRRIVELEVGASAAETPEETAERERRGKTRLQSSSPARAQLIGRYMEASRATESATRFAINLFAALQAGLAQAANVPGAPSVEQARARMEAERGTMMRAAEDTVKALSVELYHTLSDADFEAYVVLLESSAGRRITEATMQTMDLLVLECTDEMTRRAVAVSV